MKKHLSLAALLACIILLGSCLKTRTSNIDYFLSHQASTGDTVGALCVNEFCARGSTYFVDELNPASDHWIELYNRSSSTIYFDSSNFYYSNDSSVHSISGMTKLTYYSVPSHGYIVIFADDSDRVVTTPGGHIHVPHISKEGGFIGLYNYTPSSGALTTLTAYSYDTVATSGSSSGVYPNGSGTWFIYPTPSPDAPNPQP